MNAIRVHLRELILEEHSKKQMLRIVAYIGNDQKKFHQLMQLFLYDEYRVTQRAAWVVCYCIKANPALADKYLPLMIENVQKPVHVAVLRNTVSILNMVKLPGNLHAPIMDTCYKLVADNSTPIAVKAFSLSVLSTLSEIYPELKNELKSLIEDQMPTSTAAFRSRAKKIKL